MQDPGAKTAGSSRQIEHAHWRSSRLVAVFRRAETDSSFSPLELVAMTMYKAAGVIVVLHASANTSYRQLAVAAKKCYKCVNCLERANDRRKHEVNYR